MAIAEFHRERHYARRRRSDARQSWLLVCALYPLLLALAVASRLIPRSKPSALDGGRSVFAEARIAALNCIPFIFR